MLVILISFIALLSIPSSIVLLAAWYRKAYSGKPFPPFGRILLDIGFSCGITVGITLAISFVFSVTGFFDAQFFRPSKNDFGELQKLTVEYQEHFFQSKDGTRLHGYLLLAKSIPSGDPDSDALSDGSTQNPQSEEAKPSVEKMNAKLPLDNGPPGTVIHFHGSDRNLSFTLKNSAWLTQHGFNVFVFDYRGYGKSEGQPNREGVLADGIAAIEFAASLDEVNSEKMILWGQSMGGQLAINAAVGSGRKNLGGVIAEATYASFSHHVKDKMASMGPLWLIQWSSWLVTSDQYSAKETVAKLGPVPLLLVHGSEDHVVKPYHSDWLLSLAKEPKTIWKAKGGNHLNVFRKQENQELLIDYLKSAFEK